LTGHLTLFTGNSWPERQPFAIVAPSTLLESAMRRARHSPRSRFTWGILFLIVGALALATNLGFRIPRDVWQYWPLLLIALGVVQLAWPGLGRDRFGGIWLLGIGVYGWVSTFEVLDLNWGTAWPILLVSLGLSIVLRSIFPNDDRRPPPDGPGGQGSIL
jgi:hypothetical protein